jgi:hypothetical protein
VTTPDYLWRVHVYADKPGIAYAWYIKNNGDAKPKDESAHRISLRELEEVLADDYTFPIPRNIRDARSQDHHRNTTCSLR